MRFLCCKIRLFTVPLNYAALNLYSFSIDFFSKRIYTKLRRGHEAGCFRDETMKAVGRFESVFDALVTSCDGAAATVPCTHGYPYGQEKSSRLWGYTNRSAAVAAGLAPQ